MLTVSDNHIVLGGGGGGSGGGGGGGDVVGAASSTDNAVVRWDGVSGKTVQNSSVTIGDNGSVRVSAPTTDAVLEVTQTASWNEANYALKINGYSLLGGFRINGADGQRSMYLAAGQLGFASYLHPITFTTNAVSERMRINANGFVGVNETNPQQLMHINGNLRVTGAYYDSTGSAGTNGQVLKNVAGLPVWSNP